MKKVCGLDARAIEFKKTVFGIYVFLYINVKGTFLGIVYSKIAENSEGIFLKQNSIKIVRADLCKHFKRIVGLKKFK